jgi:hypothetical protein
MEREPADDLSATDGQLGPITVLEKVGGSARQSRLEDAFGDFVSPPSES